jgi:diadenosine tetraphosphate (Ap4A) HIT family hydrolase
MSNCLFCEIGERQAPLEGHPENVVLFESENFYVKPALGHFVEGYCLIVTKDHLVTMAELESDECVELENVLHELRRRLSTLYGQAVCVFEHGAACPIYRAGACIDHAHIHVLPIQCDVTKSLSGFRASRISGFGELRSFAASGLESYIYYEPEPATRLLYSCDERVSSQLMRRLICQRLGLDEHWDWRVSPLFEDTARFLARWQSAFAPSRDSSLALS